MIIFECRSAHLSSEWKTESLRDDPFSPPFVPTYAVMTKINSSACLWDTIFVYPSAVLLSFYGFISNQVLSCTLYPFSSMWHPERWGIFLDTCRWLVLWTLYSDWESHDWGLNHRFYQCKTWMPVLDSPIHIVKQDTYSNGIHFKRTLYFQVLSSSGL